MDKYEIIVTYFNFSGFFTFMSRLQMLGTILLLRGVYGSFNILFRPPVYIVQHADERVLHIELGDITLPSAVGSSFMSDFY